VGEAASERRARCALPPPLILRAGGADAGSAGSDLRALGDTPRLGAGVHACSNPRLNAPPGDADRDPGVPPERDAEAEAGVIA
jgi:hypothetical protein